MTALFYIRGDIYVKGWCKVGCVVFNTWNGYKYSWEDYHCPEVFVKRAVKFPHSHLDDRTEVPPFINTLDKTE